MTATTLFDDKITIKCTTKSNNPVDLNLYPPPNSETIKQYTNNDTDPMNDENDEDGLDKENYIALITYNIESEGFNNIDYESSDDED